MAFKHTKHLKKAKPSNAPKMGVKMKGPKQKKTLHPRGMAQIKTQLSPKAVPSQFMTQPSSRPSQKLTQVRPFFNQIKNHTGSSDDIVARIRRATGKAR